MSAERYEEITVIDGSGRRAFAPQIETARKVPALICAYASRLDRLRRAIASLKAEHGNNPLSAYQVDRLLSEFTVPLPFEKELLSADIVQVDSVMNAQP